LVVGLTCGHCTAPVARVGPAPAPEPAALEPAAALAAGPAALAAGALDAVCAAAPPALAPAEALTWELAVLALRLAGCVLGIWAVAEPLGLAALLIASVWTALLGPLCVVVGSVVCAFDSAPQPTLNQPSSAALAANSGEAPTFEPDIPAIPHLTE
jgi:hypothetical protein